MKGGGLLRIEVISSYPKSHRLEQADSQFYDRFKFYFYQAISKRMSLVVTTLSMLGGH
jgi:hypothetical protein